MYRIKHFLMTLFSQLVYVSMFRTMALFLGVGPGLAAVAGAAALALLAALILSVARPQHAAYFVIGCSMFPVLVFSLVMAAPQEADRPEGAINQDNFYPVRVSLIILLGLALVGAMSYHLIGVVLTAPPFVAPRVHCRRKQLETVHPTWVQ